MCLNHTFLIDFSVISHAGVSGRVWSVENPTEWRKGFLVGIWCYAIMGVGEVVAWVCCIRGWVLGPSQLGSQNGKKSMGHGRPQTAWNPGRWTRTCVISHWYSGWPLTASKLPTLMLWVTIKELVCFAMEKLKEIWKELEELRPGYCPVPTSWPSRHVTKCMTWAATVPCSQPTLP